MNNIQKALENGQSIWLDSISRDMLRSGELQRVVDLGVSSERALLVSAGPRRDTVTGATSVASAARVANSISHPACSPR